MITILLYIYIHTIILYSNIIPKSIFNYLNSNVKYDMCTN